MEACCRLAEGLRKAWRRGTACTPDCLGVRSSCQGKGFLLGPTDTANPPGVPTEYSVGVRRKYFLYPHETEMLTAPKLWCVLERSTLRSTVHVQYTIRTAGSSISAILTGQRLAHRRTVKSLVLVGSKQRRGTAKELGVSSVRLLARLVRASNQKSRLASIRLNPRCPAGPPYTTEDAVGNAAPEASLLVPSPCIPFTPAHEPPPSSRPRGDIGPTPHDASTSIRS